MRKVVHYPGRVSRICGRVITMTLLSALVLVPAVLMGQAAPVSHFKLLHKFTGPPDGAWPAASPLIQDAEGNLYGTTNGGGSEKRQPICVQGCGVVFKINTAGKETRLYTFTGGSDGAFPGEGLIRDADGNLYGTASGGGLNNYPCDGPGCGVVFEVTKSGQYSVLHSFTGGSDGENPGAVLFRDEAGNLYGTTVDGGNLAYCQGYGCGVIFKLAPDANGKWTETVLYTFTGGADGAYSFSNLVRDAQGNFYGTSTQGGNAGVGTVWKLNKAGKLTVLYAFTGGVDGRSPWAGLVRDAHGNLYGTTTYGGDLSCTSNPGCGVVFKLSPGANDKWKETVLHTFTGGADGMFPFLSPLVRDAQGNLYGTTDYGGSKEVCENGCGVVFRLNSAGTETVLHTFNFSDGDVPKNGLLLGANGALYGSAQGGGDDGGGLCVSGGCGVVFKITF